MQRSLALTMLRRFIGLCQYRPHSELNHSI